MSSGSYIPGRLFDQRNWMLNFSGLINLDCARYGLMPAEAASVKDRFDVFDAALTLSEGETTRNKVTIGERNLARVSMLQLVRPIAQRIRMDLGVAPEDKLALRISIPDTTPTPVVPPLTAPVLAIGTSVGLVHTVSFRDQTTPNTAAKPPGTIGLHLYRTLVAAGAPEPADPTAALFVGMVTRQRYHVEYEPADVLKTAWYWGRWLIGKGQVGPWGPPASGLVAPLGEKIAA